MITANDLKNIDDFLSEQQKIINQPKKNKKILMNLRIKIARELDKVKIKISSKSKKEYGRSYGY